MEATIDKQAAVNGYEAVGAMDADGAMKDVADGIEWVVTGDNALTGTYTGKDQVGELWMRLLDKGLSITPREFITEGNKVVVICDFELAGERGEHVNLLTYNEEGKLIRFEAFGGETLADRVFPR